MNNELSHFGIMGMRWGVRRSTTPSSGSSGRTRTSTNSLPKKALSEEEIKQQRIVIAKKALIVGTATVATGLAIYGGYKIAKFAKEHSSEIKATKELVQLAMSKGKSAKSSTSQPSVKPIQAKKTYTDAEWTKKKADILKEIQGEKRKYAPRPINPEVRARVRKDMLKNDPIYQKLIKEQVDWEAKYGPPTPAEMEWAKRSLEREGIKFPS